MTEMAQSQFSLSWSAHKSNICTGLSSLQQNGEFVDMTLAADGHHVKVHQVIIALASPYLKDLISTAQCPHPVILLNKISYTTLSAILEYIYTGEVLIQMDCLSELVEAGKELHIKGLEDMNLDFGVQDKSKTVMDQPDITYEKMQSLKEVHTPNDNENDDCCYFEIADKNDEKYVVYGDSTTIIETSETKVEYVKDKSANRHTFNYSIQSRDEDMQTDISQDLSSQSMVTQSISNPDPRVKADTISALKKSTGSECGLMQYTVSNQGSLQLILNRFVYFLKHTKRCGTRQWRCVDYLATARCPALLVTCQDVVVQRIAAHAHPFHDRKILKKVKAGAVFSAIHDALEEGKNKKIMKENVVSGQQHSE